MTIYRQWVCPKCGTEMKDEIDTDLGPFWTCVCDNCGETTDDIDVINDFDFAEFEE